MYNKIVNIEIMSNYGGSMARPKVTNINDLAVTKIEKTFWELLEIKDFSQITVLEITKQSGVNRNSFYYHYEDINDLASIAFKRKAQSIIEEIRNPLICAADNPNYTPEPTHILNTLQESKYIILCARSDSKFITKMVQNLLQEIWFDSFKIQKTSLTAEELLQANFIFAGVVSTLGTDEIQDNPMLMLELAKSPIWKAAVSTIRNFS